ncbi:MAG: DHH family phosphoesterase, partial [Ruminococcus sp.]|nr:DHH family phosphoesterase [Ruminococcus sp.]
MTFQDILKIFEENDNFLILTHKSPDGDTLGSGFALCAFLRDMGKKANVVNSDSFPERYDLIYESYYPQEFDVKYVIAVDIADTNLLGSNLSKYAEEGAIDLCIDHHISNTGYARRLLLDREAAGTAEVIFALAKEWGLAPDPHLADCLYTGIATDSGCFKYQNTTPRTHRIAAELMEWGADAAEINRAIFDTKSQGRLAAESALIRSIRYFCGGR